MSQTSTPAGGHPAAQKPTQPATQHPAMTTTYTQSDLDAACATALQTGHAQGALTERERIHTILAHPQANAKSALVQLCITANMSADQAHSVLTAAAATAAPASAIANPFAAAMTAAGNPPTSGLDKPQQSHNDPAAEMRAAIAAAAASFSPKAAY